MGSFLFVGAWEVGVDGADVTVGLDGGFDSDVVLGCDGGLGLV